MGFPGCSAGKESACNAGYLGSIPGLGRSPGGGHGNPFQYSCLENPHGQRSLVGYSPWGHRESDTTEQLNTAHSWNIYEQLMSPVADKDYLSTGYCEVSTCAKVGKVPPVSRWGLFQPPDYFCSTSGCIKGRAGKLLGGIRWLLDS